MARLVNLMTDFLGGGRGRYLGCGIFFFLLLLLLLSVSPGKCLDAAALEDRRASLCLPSDNLTSVIHNDINPHSVTLCALVRPELDQPHDPAVIIMFTDNFNLSIIVGIDSFKLWVEINCELHMFEESLSPETWNPLCFGVYFNETLQVWAAVRGILLTEVETEEVETVAETEEVEAVAETKEEEEEEETVALGLCIGVKPKSSENSFVGFVTALSIQPGSTTGPTPAASTCINILNNTEDGVPITSTWNNYGPVEVTEIEEEYLCSHAFHDVLLKDPLGYRELRRICRSFSGFFPSEEQVNNRVVEIPASEVETCTTDESHVSWVRSETALAEGVTAQCPTMLTNGNVGSRVCISELECSICRVPVGLRFTLFGAIHDFDRYYYLRMSPNGDIYFKGQKSCNITKQEDVWVLRSRLHRRSWRLSPGIQPLGRRPWFSADKNAILTLTSCNALQFSSHDGVCLLRSQRCNGRQDYPDGSDEEGCQERLLRKEPNYNSRQSPNHRLKGSGILMYRMYIENVDKIKTEVGIANVQMWILLKWHDHRMKFVDTKMFSNFLSCDDIWHPMVGIVAGNRQGAEVDIKLFFEYCFVYWEKKLIEQQDLNDPLMGKFTASDDINITHYKEISIPVPCYFKVHRYPFGTYLCNATFYLVDSKREMTWKADGGQETEYHLEYQGDRDLLDYHLEDITVLTEPKYVTVSLHLTGQFDYHLLNSFAPSALMFIICYSTLFFPIANFNERIMVSLTAMLVLAGLFAQATNNYIKTPYFKLLDIWYATLIMFCFFVVIANAVVNSLRVDTTVFYKRVVCPNEKPIVEKSNISWKALKCNRICKIILLSFFIFLIILYNLFGAGVI